MRKLTLSSTDRKICGVCGGLANYLEIDSTIIRVLMLLCVCCGYGILAYFIAAIIIPRE